MEYLHLPVANFTAPKQSQIRRFIRFCNSNRKEGKPVAVHCLAGAGRTGTMLACYLVTKGINPEKAMNTIRRKRPGSIETLGQEEAVFKFAADWKRKSRT